MRTIFFLSFFMLLFSAYAQKTHEHSKTHPPQKSVDSAVKMVDHFVREDGNGDAIIIQRDREDSNADLWFEHYLTVTRHEIAKSLKQTKASGCSNLDFENGNFSGWTCQTGTNNGYPAGSWTGTAPVANRHVITNAASGNDPYGGFPMLAPNGGTFSVKLGNDDINYEAEQLIYTFNVQPQDTNFIYKYAVVFQDPGHTWSEQPYFELKIYDGSNNVIPCSYQQYVASGSIPGFQTSGDIRYKTWTTVGINLGPYAGQTITIVVTAADCAQGGHFGYGYIDFICPSSFINVPNVYCDNITSATLTIPNIDPGMTYQWSTGETTPTITINPQNYDGQSVNVYIQSPTSAGLCGFWYAFPIEIVHITPAFNFTASCLTANFTDASTINQGSFTSWLWDFGDGTTSTSQNPSHTYTNPGNYTVTLTVSSGSCQMTTTQHVNTVAISLSTSFTNVSCNGTNDGTATVTASGGNPPYQYSWNDPAHQTTSTATNLPPGTYTVNVTDNGGCPNTATVTITQAPAATSTMNHTDVTCYGMSNGTASVSTSGGVPPYTVHWNSGQTDSSITGLGPGTYYVTLTDSHGCSITNSITISQPPQITISASASPSAVCPGGSSTLTANGAVTYSWSNGIITNPQTVTPALTTTYQVTGTDANTCTAVTSTTVTVYSLPNVYITGNNTICQGQSTTLTGNGAVNYVWTTGFNTPSITVSPITNSDYGVLGTDVHGCTNTATFHVTVIPMPVSNAGNDTAICGLTYTLHAIPSVGTGTWTSTGNITINPINSPQATITATQSGTYTLVWTENNNGCTDADSVIVQLTRIPTSTFTADTIACSGNASQINFTGISDVNSSFTWSWDGGNAIPGSGIGPHQVSWSTTGLHTVTLSVSTNGCASPVTTVIIYNPTPITTSLSKTDLLCNGDGTGAVDLTVSGGRPPYTYQWSNGATTQDLLNINGGIYTVNVSDASGCTQNNGITVNEPSKLIVSVTPTQYICISQPAYLTLTATGATPPYTYYWNGLPSNATIGVYPDTTTTYSGYVVDANGCTSPILHSTVFVAPPVHVTLIANTNHVCPGDPVMLTTVIEGGVGPPYIIYNQDGDVVTPPIYIYPQYSGYYMVRVEDACGTWDTSGVYIYVWPLPPANALADTVQGCVPLTVHFIEVNPDSGQTYLWNFGDQSNLSLAKNPVHTYTSAGTYDVTLTVTSIHGCKTVIVYNDMITVWPQPTAAFVWHPEVVTEVEPMINFVNHSTGAEWYEWMFGDGDSSSLVNPYHRYQGAGEYNVMLVAVSNKGCTDTAISPLKIIEQWTFYAPTAFSPDGDRNNDSFYIMAHGIQEQGFNLEVYDRWGEVIWSTTKYSKDDERSEKWDGRAKNHNIVPVGTYTWRAMFKDDFNKDHEKVGAVTVIR